MTQESIALRTSGGAYPGLSVVQDVNKALDTIATDFAGSADPAAKAGPYMTWADTGNMLLKRRNAAGTAWVTIGPLLDFYFARSNVLGAVSQAVGVPTGAIIEAGSNANGRYVKFASGDMFCWRLPFTNMTTSTPTGSGYQSSGASLWAFPAAFADLPVVTPEALYNGAAGRAWAALDIVSTTQATFIAFSFTNTGELALGAQAVGRWF